MTELSKKTCSACEIGAPLVPHDQQIELLQELDGWIIDNSDISKLIKEYDAFVALGCVIKGKTPHFNLISKAVINAIMNLSIRNKKPIGNGIITCLNKKQAVERADPDKKNKGGEAVTAVLATLVNF